MNLSDTWSGVLLDGLVGSLTGAAATIVVVRMTIRNERKLRTSDRLDEAVADAHTEAWALVTKLNSQRQVNADAVGVYTQTLQAINALQGRATRPEPVFGALLFRLQEGLTAAVADGVQSPGTHPELRLAARRVYITLTRWIADPDLIRQGVLDYEQINHLIAVVDAGGALEDLGLKVLTRRERLRRRLTRGKV